MSKYIATKAIIIAAGKGTRLSPITNITPKPLVSVNGTPMIEKTINALHKNGINEIYVVVGYKKEQFTYLTTKYPNLKLIENPYYDSSNNISSIYVARNFLENCIICEGDLIVYNSHILDPNFNQSGYCCIESTSESKEWLLTLNNNIVTNCSIGGKGGNNIYQLYGISFWNEEDGKKLKKHIENEFINNKNKQIFWDQISLFKYKEDYKLGIRKIDSKDIIEIDSLDELKKIDRSYEELFDYKLAC